MKRAFAGPFSNGGPAASGGAGHWAGGQWPGSAKRPCPSVPSAAITDAYRQNLLSTDYDHHRLIQQHQQQQLQQQKHYHHQQQHHSNHRDHHSNQQEHLSNHHAAMAASEPEPALPTIDLHQSPVVHASNLAPNTTEAALLHCLSSFGVVRDVVVLPSRSAAYVQFNDILAAQTAVAASRGSIRPPTVYGRRLRLQYCRQPGIDHAGALDAGRRSRVLLLVVTDLAIGGPPVTAQLLRQAASQFGRVCRLLVMRRDHVADVCVHALVEFSTIEESSRAKRHLNGAHLFPDSHKLRASYSNQSEVRFGPGIVNDACHYSADLFEAQDAPYRASLMDWPAGMVPESARCDKGVQTAASDLQPVGPAAETSAGISFHQQLQQQQQEEAASLASSAACTHRCLLLRNVPRDRINCQRLFNLLCLYGNVLRLKFLRNRPDTVMAEFGQPADCTAVLRNLSGCPLFGRRLSAMPCQQDSVIRHRSVDTLPDGSPAYADYTGSRNNRFVVAGKARRNRLCAPSSTLHFFNLPCGVTDANLSDMFASCGAERPLRLVRFGGGSAGRFASGLAEFSTREAAVRAVCLANHLPVPAAATAAVPSEDSCAESSEQQKQQHVLKLNFSDSAILSATTGVAAN